MARPRQISKVQVPPRVKGFAPIGYYSNQKEPIQLNIEEFEVIRLLDYEGLSQVEAANVMQISRPTLTRIYLRARKKIAVALTEVHQINIEGGSSIFNGTWYFCESCNCKFNKPLNENIQCPLCGKGAILLNEGK
jgi:uncharacterized protein